MPPASAAAETPVSHSSDELPGIVLVAAIASLVWYALIVLVASIGYTQIWRHYSKPRARVYFEPDDAPHVTIIRPVKGLEPRLYDCLASTLRQDYPKDKVHIRFCISDPRDVSVAVVKQLIDDCPDVDAQLFLENEDEALKNGEIELGPNPKIRNMSRAYREAVGDIIWVIDCNIWVARGVLGRMVSKLEGREDKQKYKLVHHLPLVVDIVGSTTAEESRALLHGDVDADSQIRTSSSASGTLQKPHERTAFSIGGGRLEESFMSSAHPKFYTAINTVLLAPCIIGKSTMFRRSHLDSLTAGAGIDAFSQNICEDHLIGDRLWKHSVPAEQSGGERLGKHALCFGDLAIQPMANMSVAEYCRRRVRWLRVRKFTVTLATLVEPGTECFVASLYGAFAFATLLAPTLQNTTPSIPTTMNIPLGGKAAFALFWLLSVSTWCLLDWTLYLKLHSGASIEVDVDTPLFARPPTGRRRRPFAEWLPAWLGREVLALPIWVWAFWGGTTVAWRGKRFWVGMDMRVHEIVGKDRSD